MTDKPPKPVDREATPRHRKATMAGKNTIVKKARTRTLRDVSREPPTAEDVAVVNEQIKFLLEEKEEDITAAQDRATAISVTALVEYFLEIAVLLKFENIDSETLDNLFSENGALGTFFSKIHLAYALGVIHKSLKDDLDKIRKIRNAFAHARITARFQTKEISTECRKLRPFRHFPPEMKELLEKDGLLGTKGSSRGLSEAEMSPRQTFLIASTGMLLRILILGVVETGLDKLKKQHTLLNETIKEAKAKGAEEICPRPTATTPADS